eukprot:scaffold36514_cov160-Amphora_coffeaeformis.AAC.1
MQAFLRRQIVSFSLASKVEACQRLIVEQDAFAHCLDEPPRIARGPCPLVLHWEDGPPLEREWAPLGPW